MAAQAGRKLILKIGNGASPTETFTAVGGVRLNQMELQGRVVDASDVASGGWRELIAAGGLRSLQLSVQGVFEDSAAEETLRSIAFSGQTRNFQLLFGNGDVLTAGYVVERYARSGEVGGLEEFALTLSSSGAVSYVAA